jgi:hypothetical protein
MISGWQTITFFVMLAVALPVGIWIVGRWLYRRWTE